MMAILKDSLIYRFFAAIGRWFGRQWQASRIVSAFLGTGDSEEIAGKSIFYPVGRWIRNIISAVYDKLRLKSVFTGSFLMNPFLWAAAAMVLAPIVPTLLLVGLVLASGITFIVDTASDRQRRLVSSAVNRYVIIYAALYVAATVFSVTFSGSLYAGLLTAMFVMCVFVVENAVKTKKQLKILVIALVAAGVLVSLYGFYQYIFGTGATDAWTDETMFEDISIRVYSTLQNPNVLSEYLLLIIPISAACVFTAKNLKTRLASICAFGIMCVCMLMTFSRAGWLGLLVAAAVFLIMIDRRYIILGIIGVALIFLAAPDMIISRFASIGNMSDGSTSYRVAIWLGTLKMLKDYWICGVGPGTDAFNLIYPGYSYNAVSAQHSHNLFLQITSDAGIGALIVFILIIIVILRTLCSAVSREKDRKSKIFQIAAVAGIVGFMVQSMAEYSFYNYRIMFLFWAYIGLGAVFARVGKLED